MNKSDVVNAVLESLKKQRPVVNENAREFEFVVQELRGAGVKVDSIEALKRDLPLWRKAIPTLERCLDQVTSPRVKEAVVRLLSVPFAKGVEPLLLRILRTGEDESLRWAAGNGLEVLASEKIADELVVIALDRSLGRSRQMVVRALGKLKDPRALSTGVACLSDEDVILHALSALAQMKNPQAIPSVQPLLKHSRAEVRKAARKTLERLGKVKANRPN
jgi:HEAT repeat protein